MQIYSGIFFGSTVYTKICTPLYKKLTYVQRIIFSLYFLDYTVTDPTHPAVTAAMSFIIPGTGQIYNCRYLVGIIWMFLAIGLWIKYGYLGLICHVFSAYTAFRYSESDCRDQ
jgi:hypothetical protein